MGYLAPLSWKHKTVVGLGVVVLALCAVSAVFGSSGVVHLRRLQAQQEQVEAAAFALAQRNAHLRDHLQRLETDDAYLEKIARERLGFIKPGELVYRVRSSVVSRQSSAGPDLPSTDDRRPTTTVREYAGPLRSSARSARRRGSSIGGGHPS
jgi:cell division protein FtsB